jgi:DNA-binding CsgD family transcriptional regulator
LTKVREADVLVREIGGPAGHLGLLAWLEGALGDPSAADEHGRMAVAVGETSRSTWLQGLGALGMIALSRGDHEEAHRYLAPAADLFFGLRIQEPDWEPFHGDAIEASVSAGNREAADGLVSWLEERGETSERAGVRAIAARGRGMLLAARGDHAEADRSFAAAIRHHHEDGGRYELARSLLTRGSSLRRAGRKRAARDALEEAKGHFEDLGAVLWAQRTAGEASRIGGRRPSRGALTEAEMRVARLAAAGRTNREIADTLFMSVRTVEGHLSHVYAKLGIRTRTELALFLDHADA